MSWKPSKHLRQVFNSNQTNFSSQQWFRSPKTHLSAHKLQPHQSHGAGHSKAAPARPADDRRQRRTAAGESAANEPTRRFDQTGAASRASDSAAPHQLQQTTNDPSSLSVITATLAQSAGQQRLIASRNHEIIERPKV